MVITKSTLKRRIKIIKFRKENNHLFCSKCEIKIDTSIRKHQHHFFMS